MKTTVVIPNYNGIKYLENCMNKLELARKISDFEIKGITFEVGGKNKNGAQIKDARTGYLVKDNLEYAFGNSIPIWMFGFLY